MAPSSTSEPNQSSTPPFGESMQAIQDVLASRLAVESNRTDFRGEVARSLLDAGHKVEGLVEKEVSSRLDAIGGIDNMWLHLAHYDFNPVCLSSYILGSVPKATDIMTTFVDLAQRFPKYQSKLANTGRRFHGSTFVLDPNFDMRNHIFYKSLPSPAGREELDDFIAEVEAMEWDLNKPLWELYIIDNYKGDEGAKAATVQRASHVLADGQGFVMSQLCATSYGPELDALMDDAVKTIRDVRRGKAKPSKIHKGAKGLDRYSHLVPVQIALLLAYWIYYFLSTTIEIFQSLSQGFAMTFWYLLTFWRIDKVTPDYPGPRIKEKEYATSQSFPMSDVKTIQKAFSGIVTPGGRVDNFFKPGRKNRTNFAHLTLNDILSTVIADVISHETLHPPSRYQPANPTLWQRAVTFSHHFLPRPLCLMIPISIRAPGDWSMRNWSTGALAYLPSDGKLPTDPKALYKRLHGSKKALAVLKHGYLPLVFFHVINIVTGQLPFFFPGPLWSRLQWLVGPIIETSLTATSAVVTNVPGPQPASGKQITLAGAPILNWGASPPQAGKNTLGIGIITYDGKVCVTICADGVKRPDGSREKIARRLSKAFEVRWAEYLKAAELVLEQDPAKKHHKKDLQFKPTTETKKVVTGSPQLQPH